MNKLRYILVLTVLLIHSGSFGQQGDDSSRISLGFPLYSQYLHNGLMINPAYAGSREALSLAISHRTQWMGTDGAPSLESLSIHAPLKNDKVALGLKGSLMRYGATKMSSVYAVYAYHIQFARGKLSFGLGAGADISNTDYSGLEGIVRPDPVFVNNDKPYILPNVNAGLYYFSNKFFAGLSVPSFLCYRNTGNGNTQTYHSFNEYDFIVTAGGLITFAQAFKFKPSFLVNYSLNDSKKLNQLDINGNFIIADILWVGGSWRTTEEVVVGLLQAQINQQLMIGFSYDYPAGRMSTYSKGSGEFFLRYEFGSKVSAANPRYF